MIQVDRLTFSYLEDYPEEAARVLENLEVEDVVALLTSIPARLGAPVLARILPPRAALFLDNLKPNLALALIGRLKPQEGVSIIRYLTKEKRSRLISQLPKSRAMVYRLLLAYPEETVGAWVDPDVTIISPHRSVEDALNRFRESSRQLGARIYIVGEGRFLLGDIPLQQLLAVPSDRRLDHIMKPVSFTLPAPALLKSVTDNEGWRYLDSIPVVEKGNKFIGVIHHATLVNMLARHPSSAIEPVLESTVSTVSSMYWQLVSSLIMMIIDLFPERRLENSTSKDK